ncbi:MAG: GTP cyclohydrolase I, partial [Rhodospirillaceae bacterium]|nr:GTP cyclohydrolase I [Rhodospirillaceae bacterium]
MISAEHSCMTTRGIHKPGVACVTTRFTGAFRDDPRMEERFLRLVESGAG